MKRERVDDGKEEEKGRWRALSRSQIFVARSLGNPDVNSLR
jgi:hypothetical protein